MSLPKETERLVADPAPGITAQPHDDNLRYFDVTIEGPGGSPFEHRSGAEGLMESSQDGIFKLELFLPEEYPMAPPKVRFLTKIYHPNIDKWSPALQIRTVLLSIQALLSAPNPDDPLATDVAKHYKENEKDAQRAALEFLLEAMSILGPPFSVSYYDSFMTSINSDVSYALVKETIALYHPTNLDVVLSLASTCRVIREAALSLLFTQVHWPHSNKHDEESGLHFFPSTLWPYFRRFKLIWPEDWPEASPPRWGDRYYMGGDYNPRHIDKLASALPSMPALTSFYLSCPFFPPNSLLSALTRCHDLRELSIHETPMSISNPRVPTEFHLNRLSIVPVAEAVRVGDGPFNPRYSERTYYVREYRKKYKNDILARQSTSAFLFDIGKTAFLRHVQLSADLCSLHSLAEHDWPVLDTLVLTGHAPRGNGDILDVIAKMPSLRELRLLFAKVKGEPGLRILPEEGQSPTVVTTSPTILQQLKHLAVSNASSDSGYYRSTKSADCVE
ncbi:hypothetical protein H0H93_006360 [Arthromyces matolae]|nr:hypothetical protein H0H93_006360 [Arthromyces matolae]